MRVLKVLGSPSLEKAKSEGKNDRHRQSFLG